MLLNFNECLLDVTSDVYSHPLLLGLLHVGANPNWQHFSVTLPKTQLFTLYIQMVIKHTVHMNPCVYLAATVLVC